MSHGDIFRLFSCRKLPYLTGIRKIQFTALRPIIVNTVYTTLEAAYHLNKINTGVYLSVCIDLIHKFRSSVMNVSEFKF